MRYRASGLWASALLAPLLVAACASSSSRPREDRLTIVHTAENDERARRILELLRWKEPYLDDAESTLVSILDWDRGSWASVERFREVADFEGIEQEVVGAWTMDDATAKTIIAFLESEPGRRFVVASIEANRRLSPGMRESWMIVNMMREHESTNLRPPTEQEEEQAAVRLYERHHGYRLVLSEILAISSLRAVAQAQSQAHFSALIDADANLIGESGTLRELLGTIGVRAGRPLAAAGDEWAPSAVDFSAQRPVDARHLLPDRFGAIDEAGVLRMRGYCFRVYLPDASRGAAGFTHESGPADTPGLTGGTASVGVMASESVWCAYAWPEEWGKSGTHAFFVNQTGDVLMSANTTVRWEGAKAPPGNAAFLGDGITASTAVGTRGRDGEVWRLSN